MFSKELIEKTLEVCKECYETEIEIVDWIFET